MFSPPLPIIAIFIYGMLYNNNENKLAKLKYLPNSLQF